LSAGNHNDLLELLPLLDAIPPVRGKRGRPRRRPRRLLGDGAYHSRRHRRALRARGIRAQISRPKQSHGSGLGRERWVVERTISWLHQYRRLRVRYERRADIHEAFLKLAGCLICLKLLQAEG
jgi:transposase